MSREIDRRSLFKLGGGLAVGAALLGDPATAVAAERHHTRGLRDLTHGLHLRVGTAVNMDALADSAQYRQVLVREFNNVTPENVMKWAVVEPQRGQLDFSAADELVRFARRHGMRVHAHNLVWHNQLPSWLTGGDFTDDQLEAILRQHILDEAGHFRGKVRAWDVVNEPIADDGTIRDTMWLRSIGPDYIAKALTWAHEADPHAKLYVNDYNIEGFGAKSDTMYDLLADLKQRGVPVDGVGVQGHLDIQYGFPTDVTGNLQRFADLGLEVALTEVDVRMPLPVTDEKLAKQADYFRRLMRACLDVRQSVTFTVWGFTDAYSWVPGVFQGEGAATPFDEQYRPKPAYFALRDELVEGRPRR